MGRSAGEGDGAEEGKGTAQVGTGRRGRGRREWVQGGGEGTSMGWNRRTLWVRIQEAARMANYGLHFEYYSTL